MTKILNSKNNKVSASKLKEKKSSDLMTKKGGVKFVKTIGKSKLLVGGKDGPQRWELLDC